MFLLLFQEKCNVLQTERSLIKQRKTENINKLRELDAKQKTSAEIDVIITGNQRILGELVKEDKSKREQKRQLITELDQMDKNYAPFQEKLRKAEKAKLDLESQLEEPHRIINAQVNTKKKREAELKQKKAQLVSLNA